jgi:nucleoside-diphosphate-sugar epimerase
MSLIKDPVLPKGALILVTGANGFIASHVIDHLLAAGYRVRGTVRDAQKNKWLQGFYDERYGQGKFELVEIKDYGAEGAFDAALEGKMIQAYFTNRRIRTDKYYDVGVAGVNHTASDLSFSPDPNIVVTGTVVQCVGLLKAAAATPTVQRFVYTSSSTACTLPIPNQVFTIYPDTWNEVSVEAAWKPPPYEPDRVWDVYGASKTQAEKELWKFVKENKTGLVLNTGMLLISISASLRH